MTIQTSILSNSRADAAIVSLNKWLEGAGKASAQIASGKIGDLDDPATSAVVNGLKVNLSTLSINLKNAGTGKSVAGMIATALNQASDLLLRTKSLSTQATSGAYSDVERGYMQQEAKQLFDEIDRMVSSTKFNGTTLLDGTLAGGDNMQTDTSGTFSKSSAKIQLTGASSTADDTLVMTLNGVGFSMKSSYAYDSTSGYINIAKGDTAAQQATEIANIINNTSTNLDYSSLTQEMRDKLSDLTATASAGTLTITSKRAGAGGNFTIAFDAADNNDITNIQSGANTITAAGKVNSSYDSGATSGSLGLSNVKVVGTMGHPILQGVSQVNATSGWITVAASDLQDSDTLTAFGRQFTFKDIVTNDASQIKRSASDTFQTLQNVATFLNSSDDLSVSNFTYETRMNSGNAQIKVTAKGASDQPNGVKFTIGANSFTIDASSGGANAANGVGNGIDLSHVTDNKAFYGAGVVSGFKASMTGSNAVKLSVQVGDYIYEGTVNDTAPTANSVIRMKSIDVEGKGGYFDLNIAANQGVTVMNQADADTFASNINSALNELDFYQTRKITSFNTDNTILSRSTATITAKNFEGLNVTKVEVRNSKDSSNQQAKITIETKDGRVFENFVDLSEGVLQGQKIDFNNINNTNEKISMIFGRDIDLSDDIQVSQTQNALLSAFSVNKSGMLFQVGLKSTEVISVNLDDMSTNALFEGKKLDITTIGGAIEASDAIDSAMQKVRSALANVGAFQSRFNAASSIIQGSKTAINSAISELQDVNIVEAASAYATAETGVAAAVATLSKVMALPAILLRLLD